MTQLEQKLQENWLIVMKNNKKTLQLLYKYGIIWLTYRHAAEGGLRNDVETIRKGEKNTVRKRR